jgi:Tol biopolymer transport system component
MFRRVVAAVAVGSLTLLAIAPVASATFPDKNGRIAFQAEVDGVVQLFTMKPNGHDIRQITFGEASASMPDWSPDGRTLTFTYGDCQVAFLRADGTGLRVLPPAEGDGTPGVDVCDGDSSFTPDGEHVVYVHYNAVLDKEDTRMKRIHGSDRELVTQAAGPDPNVSPDGTKISYKGNPVGALFVADIDGSDAVQVSPSVSVAYKSDWAPDGRHLVLSDNSEPGPDDTVNIATVRPDGTGWTYITHFDRPGEYANVGSYSPDGRWIVFRLREGDLFALYRIRPDGSGLHRITPWSTFLPRHVDWGPRSK